MFNSIPHALKGCKDMDFSVSVCFVICSPGIILLFCSISVQEPADQMFPRLDRCLLLAPIDYDGTAQKHFYRISETLAQAFVAERHKKNSMVLHL